MAMKQKQAFLFLLLPDAISTLAPALLLAE